MGEEVLACCPSPPCKHMGISHHADLGVAQTILCFQPPLWVASFLPCCILQTQILAKKKRHSAAEEPLPRVSELVPKAADIDSTPELTQIILYTKPMLSRASSQANWIPSPSAQPSDMDMCSHGRTMPQHAWDVSQ